MVKKLFIFCSLFLFSSEAFSSCSEESIEVKFFNVGQGNCTLVKLPGGPPLLVDAGKSAKPIPPEYLNENQAYALRLKKNLGQRNIVTDIIEEINRFLPPISTGGIDIQAIISHGDIDHFNHFPKIFSEDKFVGKAVKFILGGKKEQYEKKPPDDKNEKKKQTKKKVSDHGKLEQLLKKLKPSLIYSYNDKKEPRSLEELNGYIDYGNAEGEIISAHGEGDDPNDYRPHRFRKYGVPSKRRLQA